MVETQSTLTSQDHAGPRAPKGRFVARAAAAASIVIGTVAVASPSWAGPLMGC